MNLMRKSWADILRSPDEGGAPEPELALAAEPVIEPVVAETIIETEPVVQTVPVAAPAAPAAEVPKWALERIGEETSKRQASEERERLALERAQSFEEIVKRLQTNPKPDAPATITREPVAAPVEQSAIEQAAARQIFQRDIATISDNGAKAYGPKWADAVAALNAYGANSTDFVSNVMAIDHAQAHDIMFQIAQDGEKAVALARMTPDRRIAEITRMVMAQSAAAPKPEAESKIEPKAAPVSRAPTPKPAIAPHAPAPEVDPTTPEGNEKMSDSEWAAWYKSRYNKRSA